MRIQSLALPTFVLFLATVAAPLGAQERTITGDPARGAALLADARTALGGAEKLLAVRTIQAKGSFRRTAGNNQVEGEIELLVQGPDKMKRIEDMSPPGGGPAVLVTQTLNGGETWDENTGGGRGFGFGGGGRGGFGGGRGGGGGQQPGNGGAAAPAVQGGRGNIDPEQLRQFQLAQRKADLSRLMLVWLLATDGQVTWVGEAQAPDGTADVLEVKSAGDGSTTRLFLDAATHMPLMITWQGAALQFGRGAPGRGGAGAAVGGQPQVAPAGGQGDGAPPANQPRPDQAQGPRRGGPQAMQMTMSDYKTVNGIKFPQTITRAVNGQAAEEWSMSSYKLDQTFKSGTFEQKK